MALHTRIIDQSRWLALWLYSHLPMTMLVTLVAVASFNGFFWHLKAFAITLSVGAMLTNLLVVYQVVRVSRLLKIPAWREISQGYWILLAMNAVSIYTQAARPPDLMTTATLLFQSLWCCKALKHLSGFMMLEHDLRSWRTVVQLRRKQREESAKVQADGASSDQH